MKIYSALPENWNGYSFLPGFLASAFNAIMRRDARDPIVRVDIGSVPIGTGNAKMARAEIETLKGRVYVLRDASFGGDWIDTGAPLTCSCSLTLHKTPFESEPVGMREYFW